MKKNMGTVDRIIRFIVAVAIGVLYFLGEISGMAAIVLGIIAIVFLLTSFMSFCPLYLPFKLSTTQEEEPSASS